MGGAYTKLQTSIEGSVARFTLNFPERRNAIGSVLAGELLDAFREVRANGAARVVLLEGAGESFCGGGDLSELQRAEGSGLARQGDYADLLLEMWRFDKPIVCKVQGHALGGGLGLVAASHFAVGAEDAVFGTPEVGVGLFPMMIMAVLRRRMPRQALLDWMLLGDRHPAAEACAAGLLHAVVAREALEGDVGALCKKLLDKGAASVGIGLRALAEAEEVPLEVALPKLRSGLAECLMTEDAQEGLSAFLERRRPTFSGK